MGTKTINLRDVPEELVRRAKMFAALRGQTLKGFILESVQKALDQADTSMASSVLFGMSKGRGWSAKRTSKPKKKGEQKA